MCRQAWVGRVSAFAQLAGVSASQTYGVVLICSFKTHGVSTLSRQKLPRYPLNYNLNKKKAIIFFTFTSRYILKYFFFSFMAYTVQLVLPISRD